MSANDYYRGYIDGMRCGGQRKLQYGGNGESIEEVYKRASSAIQQLQNGDTSIDQQQLINDLNALAQQDQNQEAKQWATQILQQLKQASQQMRTGGGWGRRMQEGGQGGDPMAELQQIAQTLQQIGQAMQNGQLDERMMQALQQIGQVLQQYAQSGDPQVSQTAQQILQELYQPIIEAIQQAQQQAQQQQQTPQGQPMRKGGSTSKSNHNFFKR